LALLVAWQRWERVAVYEGKTIEEWSSLVFAPAPQASCAAAALQAMGPKAVPDLVRLLGARDLFPPQTARSLLRRLPSPIARLFSPYVNRVPAAWVRNSAARSLGIIGPGAKAAMPALLRALHQPDEGLALEAAVALTRIGNDSTPGFLLAMEDPKPNVRHAAAFALGEIKPATEDAARALVRALHDPETRVLDSVSASLEKIGLPSVAALAEVVATEKGAARDAAGALLVRIYGSWHRFAEASATSGVDPSRKARLEALKTLSEAESRDELAQRVLCAALRDPASDVRLIALQHLRLHDTNTTPVLVGLGSCLGDGSPTVRELAAQDLGNLGAQAKPAVPGLSRLLDDKDQSVRTAACTALKKLQDL
jgi:HEAT repeat protein